MWHLIFFQVFSLMWKVERTTHTHTCTHTQRKKKANGWLPFLKLLVSTSSEVKIEITFSARMVSSILMYIKKSEISNSQAKLVTRFLHEQFRKWRWFNDTHKRENYHLDDLPHPSRAPSLHFCSTHTHTHTHTHSTKNQFPSCYFIKDYQNLKNYFPKLSLIF